MRPGLILRQYPLTISGYEGLTQKPVKTSNMLYNPRMPSTQRLLSSSFLGLPYRILNMNHKKELLRSLWVSPRVKPPTLSGGFLSFAKFLSGGSIDYKLAAQPAAGAKAAFALFRLYRGLGSIGFGAYILRV